MSGRDPFADASVRQIASRVVTPRPDCLIWLGPSTNGYGRVTGGSRKGQRAHRAAWEIANGPIPEGMTIDHLCRVRLCLNPDHMELVTREENARRAPRSRSPRGAQERSAGPLDVGDTCVRSHLIASEDELYRNPKNPSALTACRHCLRENARNRHLGLTG
jgi:hypothetical protein